MNVIKISLNEYKENTTPVNQSQKIVKYNNDLYLVNFDNKTGELLCVEENGLLYIELKLLSSAPLMNNLTVVFSDYDLSNVKNKDDEYIETIAREKQIEIDLCKQNNINYIYFNFNEVISNDNFINISKINPVYSSKALDDVKEKQKISLNEILKLNEFNKENSNATDKEKEDFLKQIKSQQPKKLKTLEEREEFRKQKYGEIAHIFDNDLPPNVTLLFRGSMPSSPQAKMLIQKISKQYSLGLNFIFPQLESNVKDWYKIIDKKWTKRNLTVFKINDFDPKKLIETNQLQFPVFIKSCGKLRADGTISAKFTRIYKDAEDFNHKFYEEGDCWIFERLSGNPEYEIIASNVINITSDNILDNNQLRNKTREWRTFVVGDKITSYSRYIDYNQDDSELPEKLVTFSENFVKEHNGIFPIAYVADFCEFINEQGEVDYCLVELNDVEHSGRYEMNDWIAFVSELSNKLNERQEITNLIAKESDFSAHSNEKRDVVILG